MAAIVRGAFGGIQDSEAYYNISHITPKFIGARWKQLAVYSHPPPDHGLDRTMDWYYTEFSCLAFAAALKIPLICIDLDFFVFLHSKAREAHDQEHFGGLILIIVVFPVYGAQIGQSEGDTLFVIICLFDF